MLIKYTHPHPWTSPPPPPPPPNVQQPTAAVFQKDTYHCTAALLNPFLCIFRRPAGCLAGESRVLSNRAALSRDEREGQASGRLPFRSNAEPSPPCTGSHRIQPRLLHTKVDNAPVKAIVDIQHFLNSWVEWTTWQTTKLGRETDLELLKNTTAYDREATERIWNKIKQNVLVKLREDAQCSRLKHDWGLLKGLNLYI